MMTIPLLKHVSANVILLVRFCLYIPPIQFLDILSLLIEVLQRAKTPNTKPKKTFKSGSEDR